MADSLRSIASNPLAKLLAKDLGATHLQEKDLHRRCIVSKTLVAICIFPKWAVLKIL
jgi:hypothetical protein